MRLHKFLAHAGICSRRKAEEYILRGRVRVNQRVVTLLGTQIDFQKDRVFFDQKEVYLPIENSHIYILLNKPVGVLTSCSNRHGKSVLDLVSVNRRIYPVGRLDKNSCGLVLLTDDGDLHNSLSHPSHDHEKEYRVTTVSPLSDKALSDMAKGMLIDGIQTRRAKVKRLGKKEFVIVLKQGLNRQIRKMVKITGNQVNTLCRVRIATLLLGNLKPCQWRYVSSKELQKLAVVLGRDWKNSSVVSSKRSVIS